MNPAPMRQLRLEDGGVDVWKADLDRLEVHLSALSATLSAEEHDRCARLARLRDRDRFVARRGVLRALLGLYTGVPPGQLDFSCNRYGKPHLSGPAAEGGIHFSTSSSGGIALYAFSLGRELGVDIEQVRHEIEHEELAESFFCRREATMIRELPEELRVEAFFRCWTRKEAYVKARGEGLSLPFESFEVTVRPEDRAALINSQHYPRDLFRWKFHSLNVGPDFMVALAVEGGYGDLRISEWPL